MVTQIAFIIISWIVTGCSLLGTLAVSVLILAKGLPILLNSTDPGGLYTTGIMSVGYSFFLAPLGLIPAYFISMKLAEWLREKRGWPLRYPRRLFLLALAIPITLLILSSALLGQS